MKPETMQVDQTKSAGEQMYKWTRPVTKYYKDHVEHSDNIKYAIWWSSM